MTRPAEESFERTLESPLISRGEQSEVVRQLESALEDRDEGAYRHTDRPKAVGLSRSGSETWTVFGYEEVRDGTVGAVVEIRTRDHCIERVVRGAWSESGGTGLRNDARGLRLNRQEAKLFEEFAKHPERFVRYNPDDEPIWEHAHEPSRSVD